MIKRLLISFVLVLVVCWPLSTARGQETQLDGPYYIVQPGDNLWSISQRFGVSVDELVAKNDLADPGQLAVGQKLVIPGLEGLQGELVTQKVPFGENFRSISRRYEIAPDLMARLNHFTSPAELYAGSSLIVPSGTGDLPKLAGGRVTLAAQQSLFELAITRGLNPWVLRHANQLPGSWAALPGETLHLPNSAESGPGALPPEIAAIQVITPLIQGQTLSIRYQSATPVFVSGQIGERAFSFFQLEQGVFAGLQGIHAMLPPGLYSLELSGALPDGTPVGFSQPVAVWDGGYPFDPPLVVNSETVDVANTQPEDMQWAEVVLPITPQKLWQGMFVSPVPAHLSDCYPSLFGNRRSYNGSAYTYFHTGLDFCGQIGVDIYAAAAGVVVAVEELTVRGNATVIDHGWGVYTAYAHQSEILVETGQKVEAGQLIGKIGSTGRVTGPHLHWEVIVGGMQVDPLQWLAQQFP